MHLVFSDELACVAPHLSQPYVLLSPTMSEFQLSQVTSNLIFIRFSVKMFLLPLYEQTKRQRTLQRKLLSGWSLHCLMLHLLLNGGALYQVTARSRDLFFFFSNRIFVCSLKRIMNRRTPTNTPIKRYVVGYKCSKTHGRGDALN